MPIERQAMKPVTRESL